MSVETLNSNDLINQRCLVMGGGGFIGTNLCRALRGRVRRLKSFSKHPTNIEGCELIQGDFLNTADIIRAVEDVDIVFHLISTSTPASSNADPILDAQQNILQTLQLLDACCSAQVKRIIFISSGGTVYGDAKVIPTPENYPEHPICAYGVSKLAIEKYLHLYERLHGIVAINLRVSNPYGPYQYAQKKQGVIGAFISKFLASQPIEIWGDGSVVRDYVYIEDVVEAMINASVYNGGFRTFNIGSGIGTSLRSIINVISEHTNQELNIVYKDSRTIDVSRSVVDCSLAQRELRWSANHDLKSGIGKTLSWFRIL
ncbi:NAD-dependent epimerase/dehydratase family protein [Pseudomonas sp. PH1b]|uniref:NAD-dependent epimerase/dehydratase family protein n=1 Tax=Pseudomonas sp. PH1b TaxID=1397282 RepID=UPI0009E09D33|nr:NAD-dependent epimerase/dehydratase family protein [Pseudomonas sp. PH1b]